MDLNEGHEWLWEGEDGLWKHPLCSSWCSVDLTSGAHHSLRTGGPQAPINLLTINGSLSCPACQTHGYIVNGKWVEA